MEELRTWGQAKLDAGVVEVNSGLGQAIFYFDKHFQELTAFCRVEGAQLDNNLMERQLKLVVRNRKNAMFHKTLAGASVVDVVTSMIATASWAGNYDASTWVRVYSSLCTTPAERKRSRFYLNAHYSCS